METVLITVKNTNQNATILVKEALAKAAAVHIEDEQQVILRFEPSEYHFWAEEAFEGAFYPANNECGVKKVIFPLMGCRNLTIDGGGSRFVFCDRVTPFAIQNSKNIKLKNFIADFSFPRYNWATVTAVSEEGISISMDRQLFDYSVRDGNLLFGVGSTKLSTRSRKISVKGIHPHRGTCFFYVGDIDIDINPAAPTVRVDAEELSVVREGGNSQGDIRFRYREGSFKPVYEVGDKLCLAYDNNRENFFTFAELSKGLTFERITIRRNGGMGIFGQLCSDIVIDGLCVAPEEGREEYFTTTADAMHFINCDGRMEIRNSRVENAYDDALNVHGVYCMVQEICAPDRVKVGWGNAEQVGMIPFMAGDTAAVNDPKSGAETGRIIVSEVICNEERTEISLRFAEEITDCMKIGDMLENPLRMPQLLLENNTVLNCPHMRVSAPVITVRGNKLGLLYADIHINDLFGFWCESGAVQQARIEDNHFLATHDRTCIDIRSERLGEQRKQHKEITIRNNVFEMPEEKAIHAEACEKLRVEGNRFVR